MRDVLIVGAGPSGLGAATALAPYLKVRLIDRIPVVGGEAGWRSTFIRESARRAEDLGVLFQLGTNALRWDGSRALLAAPGRIAWSPGDQLLFAGGRRPGTASDLHLLGDRPSGVLPATVAEHLLEMEPRLWKAPLIIGTGRWAPKVASQLHEAGVPVAAVLPPHSTAPWADDVVEAHGSLSVIGRERVRRIRIHQPGGPRDIDCDALILNGESIPNRNIDGALSQGSRNVQFIQPLDEESPEERFRAAFDSASHWLSDQGEKP